MEVQFVPAIPLLGIYPKNPETLIRKVLCSPMFIAALFTIAKVCKQLKCPSVDEWIKGVVHLYNGILHGCKKEGTLTLWDSMDGPGEYNAE